MATKKRAVGFSDREKAAYYRGLYLQAQYPVVKTTAYTPRRYAVSSTSRNYSKPVATKKVVSSKTTSSKLKSSSTGESKSFGHRVGSTLGGMIGHGIQGLIKQLTGFGDYSVMDNSIFKGGIPPIEIVNSSKQGGVIVRHREFLGNIMNTSVFTNTVYPLNPGLGGTFPWLAGVANAYEQYRFRGVVVEFKSTSSDAVLSTNASGSLGSVMIATQYDSVEPAFTDQATMLNHEFSNSRKPSEDFCHPIECKSSLTANQLYYVRNSDVVAGSDERLYDLGLLQIATEGMQGTPGTSSCGQLWITYEVELYKPRSNPGAPVGSILSDHFQLANWGSAHPLGLSSTRSSTSSLKGTILSNGQGYRFPLSVTDGDFLFVICWKGGSVTAGYPTISSYGGVTFRALWSNNQNQSEASPSQGVTTTNMMYTFLVNVNGSGGGINLAAGGVLPGATQQPCDMFITQIDTDLLNTLEGKKKRKKPGKRRFYLPGEVFPDIFDPVEEAELSDDSSSGEYIKVKKDTKRLSVPYSSTPTLR